MLPNIAQLTGEVRLFGFAGFFFSFHPVDPVILSKREFATQKPLNANGFHPAVYGRSGAMSRDSA
jgi:hypothetical protein